MKESFWWVHYAEIITVIADSNFYVPSPHHLAATKPSHQAQACFFSLLIFILSLSESKEGL